jgi:hypothetical protein
MQHDFRNGSDSESGSLTATKAAVKSEASFAGTSLGSKISEDAGV